jgi:putative addiction module component (TIGR02574 family)
MAAGRDIAHGGTQPMDFNAVLSEVDSWPVDQRIQLVQTVWDRLLEAGFEPALPASQRADLDRRLAALEASPEDVLSWEQVQDHLRRPR